MVAPKFQAVDAAMQCPICNGTQKHGLQGIYDDRYGYPTQFNLLECVECGHKVLDPLLSDAQLGSLYTDYYPRAKQKINPRLAQPVLSEKEIKLSGAKAQPWRWVPDGVSVLDIGCGFGIAMAAMEAKGCWVMGCEADANIAYIAQEHGMDIKVGLFNPDDYAAESFDYVTMAQVIEHMVDPVATLKQVSRVLKPGGRVILSMPNAASLQAKLLGRRWINWHVPYHLQHFNRSSVEGLARQAGYELEHMDNITPTLWMRLQVAHALWFPRLGDPSPVWNSEGVKQGWRQLIMRVLSHAHHVNLFEYSSRLLDYFWLGDSIVAQLTKPSVDRTAGP